MTDLPADLATLRERGVDVTKTQEYSITAPHQAVGADSGYFPGKGAIAELVAALLKATEEKRCDGCREWGRDTDGSYRGGVNGLTWDQCFVHSRLRDGDDHCKRWAAPTERSEG